MTAKERRKLKHTLKTNIDRADMYIKLALIGNGIGINTDEYRDETKESRATIVKDLTMLRDAISKDSSSLLSEIDNLISNLK